jgi:hypothetical protein
MRLAVGAAAAVKRRAVDPVNTVIIFPVCVYIKYPDIYSKL